LLFAQWAGLTSLRQIVAALGGQSGSFYHLNLRAPCRSTLADANAERPAPVFRDIAMALIPVAAGALRQESEALVRLLDATPIPLKDEAFAWAEANARTRGLKLHLQHDPRQSRPVWFEVTSAKIDKPALVKAGVVAGRANDFKRPAADIAQLYKERWEIELLFKWLKQNLEIRRFLGRSENAVRMQIYVALIAFMLLRILHHGAARALKASTALLLTRLKVSLFRPLDLRKPRTPPPKPPSRRPPPPQFRLAFR
jgi:hypothetical protein